LIKIIISAADFWCMKIVLFIVLISTALFAEHIYEKKASKENLKAMENRKIKCRLVCDKKLYKEQKIADALSFYRASKLYKFTKEF